MTRPLTVLTRVAWVALLWIILTGAELRSPAIIVVTIAAAVFASVRLWRERAGSVRWIRVPALLLYFFRASLMGGVDVARRAFSPAMPLDPDVIRYRTTVATETALVCFVWMVSLMPGTASVDLEERDVTVHLIDRRTYGEADLRRLERRIVAVFGARESS